MRIASSVDTSSLAELPSLAELGFHSCPHIEYLLLSDGFKICIHCGASGELAMSGGDLRTRRFLCTRTGSIVKLLYGPPKFRVPKISPRDWVRAEEELVSEMPPPQ